MRILIAVLSLSFRLASNMNAIGNGADLHENLSVPLIVIMFLMSFILMLIIAAAIYLFFMYIFKDGEK
jgi:hypothetical protein